MSNIDRTKLNVLLPNLEVGQIANPLLRADVFDQIYDLLELMAREADVLLKTNTTTYTPTQPYHPMTKKYVDDALVGIVAGNLPLGSVGTQYLSDGAVTFLKLSTDVQTAVISSQLYSYKNVGGAL